MSSLSRCWRKATNVSWSLAILGGTFSEELCWFITHQVYRVYIRTVCTYIHTYIHTDIQTYIHTYLNTYIHTYIHTYIYIYIYMYIHICIWAV